MFDRPDSRYTSALEIRNYWISDALREKCLYSEYLSVFSPNAGKYGLEKLEIQTLFMQWWTVKTISWFTIECFYKPREEASILKKFRNPVLKNEPTPQITWMKCILIVQIAFRSPGLQLSYDRLTYVLMGNTGNRIEIAFLESFYQFQNWDYFS